MDDRVKELEKRIWEVVPDIHEAVGEYELRGDEGDYTPNKNERFLIEDFTHGFIEELIEHLASNPRAIMKE
jgi:hypothetical protein